MGTTKDSKKQAGQSRDYNSVSEWIKTVKSMNNIRSARDLAVPFIGDTKKSGTRTLMQACEADYHLGVQLLLRNGENPNTRDFKSFDALYYCVFNSSLRALEVLLKAPNLDPNRVYGKKRLSILHVATEHSKKPLDVIKILLGNKKFDANFLDQK